MAAKSTFRDIDRGLLRIVRELRTLQRLETRVGLHADAQHKDPDGGTFQQTAAIGAIHEFGAPGANIPRRPWLSSALERNARRLAEIKRRLLASIYEGRRSARQSIGLLGQAFEDMVKANITQGPWVPNAPGTIAAKGSDRPLIDTAQMRASVRHVERERAPGEPFQSTGPEVGT